MKKNKKGFTLAELLIVVAIIAVLVAISIPIFTAQLKKARLAANKANARAALSAAMAEFIDAPEEDKATTIADKDQHMYFRYDIATGQCTYKGVSNTSPNKPNVYDSFANIGYYQAGGKGVSDVSKWTENTKSQVRGKENENGVTGILTKRTYRYWDVAMQGDGTFLAIVCLW
ncbi:MAG: pilin [Bilifractor sp.]|jgi:prepilin-type N-terminal cleavage/methylation domain-containing protein